MLERKKKNTECTCKLVFWILIFSIMCLFREQIQPPFSQSSSSQWLDTLADGPHPWLQLLFTLQQVRPFQPLHLLRLPLQQQRSAKVMGVHFTVLRGVLMAWIFYWSVLLLWLHGVFISRNTCVCCTDVQGWRGVQVCMLAYMYSFAYAHTDTYTHMDTHTQAHTHVCTHTHTQMFMRMHTQTHTHTHT